MTVGGRLHRIAPPALTVLLHLLLLDAAVETTLSGSPVRWWVAGGVAIYLGGSAVVWWRWPDRWRSMSWRARATASVFVLLGLFAATAWLPGGLDRGMVVLGLETPVLLHVITAGAVVAAGASLAKLPSLPRAARAVVVLLTLYGATAFVIGITGGMTYTDVLGGAGFRGPLPFWLQGARISVLLLLPAAIALPLVEDLVQRANASSVRRIPLLAVALALIVAIAGTRAGNAESVMVERETGEIEIPGQATSAPEGEREGLRPERSAHEGPAGFATARDSLRAHLERIRNLRARLERPATTPAGIGRLLEFDPYAVWAFVREGMRYEPYRGVLRGPQGTLVSGAGNSFDLALLMGAMLVDRYGTSGLRIAAGELTREQADALVRRAARAPPTRSAVAAPRPAPPGAPSRGESAAPGEGVRSRGAAAGSGPRSASDETGFRGESGSARRAEGVRVALEAARGNRRQVQPLLRHRRIVDERPAAIADARRHGWLQVREANEWITLDPAGALPLPDSVETFGLHEEDLREFLHLVTIRVEVERPGSGSLERETAVEGSWPTAVLAGRGLELSVSPMGFTASGLLDPERSGSILDHAAEFDRFTVLLGVTGEDPVAAATLGLDGSVTASAGPFGGGAFDVDVFDQLPGPRQSRPSGAGIRLTGLWLTVEVDSPGGATHRVERPLLDRLGPAARRTADPEIPEPAADPSRIAIRLVQRHQLLFPVGRIGFERIAGEALQGLTERALERALALRHGRVPPTSDDTFDDLELPVLPADLIRVSDNALSLTEAHLAGDGIAYLAGSNIYLRSEGLLADADGEILHRVMLDLARNRVRTLGDSAAAAEARLLHGLWASELEGRTLDSGEGRPATTYAAGVLRAAGREDIEMRLIRTTSDVDRVRTDDDARATMLAQVVAGHVLLAPSRPVPVADRERSAWWRLDRDGHLLAIGPRGRGQATSEGQLVLEHISKPMVKRTMHFVACLNRAVAGGAAVSDAAGNCMAEWLIDLVKYSLDQAIDHFVTGPLKEDLDQARAEMLGEEYERLYQNAREAWDAYNAAREAAVDPTAVLPESVQEGIEAGREAADAGADIGTIMGFRMYLLLTMGDEIAEYASRL